MFQSLIETKAEAAPRSLGSFGFAFGLHAMLLAGVVVGSYLLVGKITPPDIDTVTFWIAPVPQPQSDGGGGGGGGPVVVPPQRPREPERVISPPEELQQPVVVPDPPLAEPAPPIDVPGFEGTEAIGPIEDGNGPGPGGPGRGNRTGPGIGDGDGPPGGTGDDGPIFVDGTVEKPELLVRVQPRYPETARLARIPGTVLVQAVISSTGRVESVEVIRSSNPIFDNAAKDAVRQWRYKPATQNNRPVAVYFTVEVRFLLQ